MCTYLLIILFKTDITMFKPHHTVHTYNTRLRTLSNLNFI